MLSHIRMDVPYEYTHMERPIRVWANQGAIYSYWVEHNYYTGQTVN